MKPFFRQIEDIPLENSPVSVEIYFRGENASGLIEKRMDAGRSAVLLFAGGEPGAAYLLEDDQHKHISLAEFSALPESQVRRIILPGVAGRLLLLALESQVEKAFPKMDREAWKAQSTQWKQEQWSGLVEVRSDKLHGFEFFWRGEPQKSDLVFSTSKGFVNDFPGETDDDGFEVISYSHTGAAQAYQCTILRQAAIHWSRVILSRYQEMVGQKFLQMMDRELNRQLQPWQWNIVLEGREVLDRHFFPYLTDAAHAYRALFMAMGAQMDFVIGGHLTQKLLSETFEQVDPDERAILQSQRLVPAAFSE